MINNFFGSVIRRRAMSSAEYRQGLIKVEESESGGIRFRVVGTDEVTTSLSDATRRAKALGITERVTYSSGSPFVMGPRSIRNPISMMIDENPNLEFEYLTSSQKQEAVNLIARQPNSLVLSPGEPSSTIVSAYLRNPDGTRRALTQAEMYDEEGGILGRGKSIAKGLTPNAVVMTDEQGNISPKMGKRQKGFFAEKYAETATQARIEAEVFPSFSTDYESRIPMSAQRIEAEWDQIPNKVADSRGREIAVIDGERFTKLQYKQYRMNKASQIASDGLSVAGKDFYDLFMRGLKTDYKEEVARLDEARGTLSTVEYTNNRNALMIKKKRIEEFEDIAKRGGAFNVNARMAGLDINISRLKNLVKDLKRESPEDYKYVIKDLEKTINKFDGVNNRVALKGNLLIFTDLEGVGLRVDPQNLNVESVLDEAAQSFVSISDAFKTSPGRIDIETFNTLRSVLKSNEEDILAMSSARFQENVRKLRSLGRANVPEIESMLEEIIESSNNPGQVRKARSALNRLKRESVSLAGDPNLFEFVVGNYRRHMFDKDTGLLNAPQPGALAAEAVTTNVGNTLLADVSRDTPGAVGRVLRASDRVSRGGQGFTSLSRDIQGLFIGEDTAFNIYASAGGFDWDDNFMGVARWTEHEGSFRLLLPSVRRPNAIGEYSLFEIDIKDQFMREVIRSEVARGTMHEADLDSYENYLNQYFTSQRAEKHNKRVLSKIREGSYADVSREAYIERIASNRTAIIEAERGMKEIVRRNVNVFGDGNVVLDPRYSLAGSVDDAVKEGRLQVATDQGTGQRLLRLPTDDSLTPGSTEVSGLTDRFLVRFDEEIGSDLDLKQYRVAEMRPGQLMDFYNTLKESYIVKNTTYLGEAVNTTIFADSVMQLNKEAIQRYNLLEGKQYSIFEQESIIDRLIQSLGDPESEREIISARQRIVRESVDLAAEAVARAKEAGDLDLMKNLGLLKEIEQIGKINQADRAVYEDAISQAMSRLGLTTEEIYAKESQFTSFLKATREAEDFQKEIAEDIARASNIFSSGAEAERIANSRRLTNEAEALLGFRNSLITEYSDIKKASGVSDDVFFSKIDDIVSRQFARYADEDGFMGRRATEVYIRTAQLIQERGINVRAIKGLSLDGAMSLQAEEFVRSGTIPADGVLSYISDIEEKTQTVIDRTVREEIGRVSKAGQVGLDDRAVNLIESINNAAMAEKIRIDDVAGILRQGGFQVSGIDRLPTLSADSGIVLDDSLRSFYRDPVGIPNTLGELMYQAQGTDEMTSAFLKDSSEEGMKKFRASVDEFVGGMTSRYLEAGDIIAQSSGAPGAAWVSDSMSQLGYDAGSFGTKARNEASKATTASNEIIEHVTKKKGLINFMKDAAQALGPFRKHAAAGLGLLTAAGVAKTIRDKDRTPEDMQGNYNMPGGNPYTDGPQNTGIPDFGISDALTGETVKTRAARYVLRLSQGRENIDMDAFYKDVAAITGQSANVTTYSPGSNVLNSDRELVQILEGY